MKGISAIIAYSLVFMIAVSLTSTAYLWGKPLIEKRQDASITERIYDKFNQNNANSLPRVIEDVANDRGVRDFDVGADGIWRLNEVEESLEFIFSSRSSNIAAETKCPISLTPGVQCVNTTPLTISPECTPYVISPPNGTLGQDSASAVCVEAFQSSDRFNMTYKIWFRTLYNNPMSATNGFRIDMQKDESGLLASSNRRIKITFGDSIQQTVNGINLITKQIKILLI